MIIAKIKTNKQIEQIENNGHEKTKNPLPSSCHGHQSKRIGQGFTEMHPNRYHADGIVDLHCGGL